MPGPDADCAMARTALLEHHVEGLSGGSIAPRAAAHVRVCPECARYEAGLRLAPALFRPPGPHYTPALRRRTLAALAAAEEGFDPALLPLLVLVAALSLVVSIAAPLWIATRLLAPIAGSFGAASALALLLCTSPGIAASCAAVFLLGEGRGAGDVFATHKGGRP